jgi:hypothetical protein
VPELEEALKQVRRFRPSTDCGGTLAAPKSDARPTVR